MNTVVIDGIITRDVELKAAGQYTVAKFSIAQKDERGASTSFFDIEAWNELGTQVSRFKKGQRVTVHGANKQDNWLAPDGTKRNRVKIIAKAIVEENKPSAAPLEEKEINVVRQLWP